MQTEIGGKELRAVIDTYGGKVVRLYRPGGREYIWGETYCYWPDRAGVLFPTCGRVYEERMTYRGKSYPLPLHGVAYTSEMRIVSRTDDSVTLELKGGGDDKCPLPSTLRVIWSVRGSVLSMTAEATNEGDEDMYCAFGFHPWMNVPIDPSRSFEDYYVTFPNAGDVRRCVMSAGVLDTGVREEYPTDGGKLRLRHSLFDDDALMLEGTGGVAVIGCGSGEEYVFTYDKMPYIGFWHLEKKEVPFLCLEPMTALPGREGVVEDWNTRPDITKVAAGGKTYARATLEVRRGGN